MPLGNQRIIVMQWAVIGVLVIGGGIAFFMLLQKTDVYREQAAANNSNIASLKEQVRQAAANRTPVVTPLPEATTNGPAAPTPTPKPAVKR